MIIIIIILIIILFISDRENDLNQDIHAEGHQHHQQQQLRQKVPGKHISNGNGNFVLGQSKSDDNEIDFLYQKYQYSNKAQGSYRPTVGNATATRKNKIVKGGDTTATDINGQYRDCMDFDTDINADDAGDVAGVRANANECLNINMNCKPVNMHVHMHVHAQPDVSVSDASNTASIFSRRRPVAGPTRKQTEGIETRPKDNE